MVFARKFLALALFICAASIPSIAAAQGTTVIVIDQAKIMRESAAGKDIQQKVKSIGEQMANELKPEAEQLSNEEKSLSAQIQGLTPEALQQNETLKNQVVSFRQRAGDYSRKRNKRAAELSATERQAWLKFNEALRPVLQEVINERGAAIVLDRSQIVYTVEASDVTDALISKLNSKAPTVQVSRVNLPDQPVQQ